MDDSLSSMIDPTLEEDYHFTITTVANQQVEFFHSLVFKMFLDLRCKKEISTNFESLLPDRLCPRAQMSLSPHQHLSEMCISSLQQQILENAQKVL